MNKKKSKFSKYFLCCVTSNIYDTPKIFIGMLSPTYLLEIKKYLDTIKPTIKYLNFTKNIMLLGPGSCGAI